MARVKRKGNISREEVLDAALRCSKKFGVARTRIVDVAEEAGISRQTIYRLFATREEIFERIAGERMIAIANKLREQFSRYTSLREALIKGSEISVQMGRSDELLNEIFMQVGGHDLNHFFFAATADVHQHMLELWSPLLDKAREAGELRPGLTNEKAVEWIRNIHGMLNVRDDYDSARRQEVLETFLVPSLLENPSAS
jgi:AcrR family transcriptional regulator